VIRAGMSATEDEIRGWLAERVAKWWLPDRVVFVRCDPSHGRRQISQARSARALRGAPDGLIKTYHLLHHFKNEQRWFG
jgi:acyl-CoA synthetase (AMP-forming)/AMP-acid ligase II